MIDLTSCILKNYQNVSLEINNPALVNSILIFMFFLICILSSKKCVNQTVVRVMDRTITEQLRGLAIFFIIIGHIWIHVSSPKYYYIFSYEAVALFLLISGFGIVRSSSAQTTDFFNFASKRFRKVMIPYWISTFTILTLDYLVLDQTYTIKEIGLTFLGVNIGEKLRHIDYVRWFITFLLMWYGVFFAANKIKNRKVFLIVLYIFGFVLLIVNYYFLRLNWYQFFAFPTGCMFAVYYDQINHWFSRYGLRYAYLAVFIIICMLLLKSFWDNPTFIKIYFGWLPYIVIKIVLELNHVLVSISVVYLFALNHLGRNKSTFLSILGKYSFELFLVHAVLLIKYNPLLMHNRLSVFLVEFSLLFGLIMGTAIVLGYISKYFRRLIYFV